MNISQTNLLAIKDELETSSRRCAKAAACIDEYILQERASTIADLTAADGGPDPFGDLARALASSTETPITVTATTEHPPCASFAYTSAVYGPAATAVDNSGTLDIRAMEPLMKPGELVNLGTALNPRWFRVAGEIARVPSHPTTLPEFEQRDGIRASSRAGMNTMEDYMEEIDEGRRERPSSISEPRDVRARMRDELLEILRSAIGWPLPKVLDRILDALRDPAHLHESETFRFGEYSRRNIEAFIDDVRGKAI